MDRDKSNKFTEIYEIESELIWSLYWGLDYSTREISKLFGCHKDTIIWKMRKFGIPRKDGYSNHTKVTIESELLLALYYGNNYTTTKISNIFDWSTERIVNLLNKYDIPIKDRSYYECWNKGTKGIVKENSGSFKEGNIPWNKGKIILHKLICQNCEREFKHKNKIKKFCSRECYLESISGENSHLWKGGLSLTEDELRHSRKLRNWRYKVVKRDNYTCQICHSTDCKIHAHHIKSWKDYPDERFNIDNGISLCVSCHIWVHNLNPLNFQ